MEFAAVLMMAWARISLPQTASTVDEDLNSCRIHEVRDLPGSHQFASGFLEAIATDPGAQDPNVVWGLTADLSSKVLSEERALYVSKSIDGGKTWAEIARVDSKYLDAGVGEGERNGLGVAPGGNEFVITTQRGAFQVLPQASPVEAVVRPIEGLLESQPVPQLTITKRVGEPIKGGSVLITADGKHMVISYGYFDRDPHILAYRKADDGAWVKDGPLPPLPTTMDVLSMQFGDQKGPVSTLSFCGYRGSGLPVRSGDEDMDSHRRSGGRFGNPRNEYRRRTPSGRVLGDL